MSWSARTPPARRTSSRAPGSRSAAARRARAARRSSSPGASASRAWSWSSTARPQALRPSRSPTRPGRAAARDPQYAAASRELQTALRQRNAQLLAVRNGAPASTLDPWDAQFARAAAALGRRRRDLVAELTGSFAAAAGELAPEGNSFTLQLVSQLAAVGYDK